jgi:hypothetical protein
MHVCVCVCVCVFIEKRLPFQAFLQGREEMQERGILDMCKREQLETSPHVTSVLVHTLTRV